MRRLVQFLVLAALCVAAFSNASEHAFQLDSGHVVVSNPTIRDLGNIPSFFVDARTSSSLSSNLEYRPVLQITHALNYRLFGLAMPGWHATQMLLHLLCAFGLVLFGEELLRSCRPDAPPSLLDHAPFVAAAVHVAHPITAGVVCYQSARSSLLTATFLLPSFALYLRALRGEARLASRPLAALLYGLALFTKVEAIGGLAVYFMLEVLDQAGPEGERPGLFASIARAANGGTLRRLAPFLGASVVYFGFRNHALRGMDASRRQAADVTALDYLRTQVVVWWRYVAKWFAPVGLVADYQGYPIRRSFLDPVFLLALAGWGLVVPALVAEWGRRPWLALLAVSALALLSPTSSVVPLAEPLNEHRPYLPVALLSLTWISVALGRLGGYVAEVPRRRVAFGLAALVGMAALVLGTRARNEVYLTEEAYWKDVLSKAPSARSHVNYGLALLRRNAAEEAHQHFETSARLAPRWHIPRVNLALSYWRRGDLARARTELDLAVTFDVYSGTALTYRGEFLLAQKEYPAARADLEAALGKSVEYARLHRGLATALAGLGEPAEAYAQLKLALARDRAGTLAGIVKILAPFFERAELAAPGLEFLDLLVEDLPGEWWVHQNIAELARRVGDTARSTAAAAKAAELKG